MDNNVDTNNIDIDTIDINIDININDTNNIDIYIESINLSNFKNKSTDVLSFPCKYALFPLSELVPISV